MLFDKTEESLLRSFTLSHIDIIAIPAWGSEQFSVIRGGILADSLGFIFTWLTGTCWQISCQTPCFLLS